MSDYLGKNSAPMIVQSPGKPVRWARGLADVLTLSRLIGSIVLVWLPWEATIDALRRLVQYSLLLWTTDAVDGRIARRSHLPASWLGKRDIFIDCALAFAVCVALARSGYIPGALLAAWLGVCLVTYGMRPVDTVLLIFMLPLHLALPVLAFMNDIPEFKLYFIWVAVIAVLNYKRLKWVIELFINGLPERLRTWVWSWLPAWLRLTPSERESFHTPEAEKSRLEPTE